MLGPVPSDLESLLVFPTFTADRDRQDPFLTRYANVVSMRLALWLDGRWWLGVVGRAGVGWREGPMVLLSIFALRDGALLPMAGYRIEVGAGRLREARVEDNRG